MAQFNKTTQTHIQNGETLHEVNMLATKDGVVVGNTNPLPVTLGSDAITITGNVNVGTTVEISNEEGNPIPTHAHLYDENDNEYTASNPLTVDGTVNIGTMPEVEIKNDSGNPIPISANTSPNSLTNPIVTELVDQNNERFTSDNRFPVDITGQNVNINGYHTPSAFAAIDNYDDAGSNVGWKFQDDWIPAFGIRVKPDSGTEFHLIDFSITLNGGTSVVAGYRWHMNPTLDAAYTWVDLGSTGVQYVKFEDIDGTPNQITSDTMVHSQAMVGKTTNELTPEMKQFPFTDGGIEMFLEIRRLDGGATQDMFYHLTFGID